MKQVAFAITACAAFVSSASARALTPEEQQLAALIVRAFPANGASGYTPQTISCPPNVPSVRQATGLSANETAWLQVRRQETISPMRDLLGRLNITGFDTNGYIDAHSSNVSALPNIGIAISGGGYRAMLNGAGVIEAFDSRTPNSTHAGQVGGLLQSATYLSGLSGGSWLVGSLYTNNFTSVNSILAQDTSSSKSGSLWQLGNSIFEGPDKGGIQVLDSAGYYKNLADAVDDKKDAGYNTSITDIWGRALSFQLVNATDGGPGYTFSSIAQQDWFTSGSVPLPLLVADSRAPHTTIVSSNSTIFYFSPWELGSDDPTLYSFAPLQYIGTNFTGGNRVGDQCVVGYDNVGFVMGTSSSLFNQILTTINGANATSFTDKVLQGIIATILEALGEDKDDIAAWPNPFYGFNNGTNIDANVKELTLVDGGEDGQNIPLHPLIQPNRHVDVIFAVDSSADTNATYPAPNGSADNWPVGISLVDTYERSLDPIGNGTVFPAVPDINTFVNLGLNSRPTFFGCNASNLTGPAPLIVYLPNAPYVYQSNTSTFAKLSYNDTERNAMVLNGYNLATQSNSTVNQDWTACVGCAILSRSLTRTGTTVPDTCTRCFQKYCWDGTVNSTTPGAYVPGFKSPEAAVKVTSAALPRSVASAGMAITAALIVGFTLV